MTRLWTQDFEIHCLRSERTTRRISPRSLCYLPGVLTVRAQATLSCLAKSPSLFLPPRVERDQRRFRVTAGTDAWSYPTDYVKYNLRRDMT